MRITWAKEFKYSKEMSGDRANDKGHNLFFLCALPPCYTFPLDLQAVLWTERMSVNSAAIAFLDHIAL